MSIINKKENENLNSENQKIFKVKISFCPGGLDMRKVIVLIILVTVIGFAAGQLTWTQVNTDGFGDAPNEISFSMTVYSGNLYVGIDNCMTGTEDRYRGMEIQWDNLDPGECRWLWRCEQLG
ncbi:MAG: hypothetical protein AYK18_10115 [Theionarchaea archaeon DG-70]|nr:MAG: hypothetical protein AYK18_10115 [Theionarchaea archaeon DG-70]